MENKEEQQNIALIGGQLNKNLSTLMESNNISLTTLHRNTGIAIPTIKRLQIDPHANPTICTLLPIANFFKITVNQLIGTEPLQSVLIGYAENKHTWLKVPIINWDQIPLWNEKKNYMDNAEYSHISTDVDVGGQPYALRVEENDWVGFLKDSILIIDSELTPEHRDYAIVGKSGNERPTLKQVLIDEDKIYLKSLNIYFSPTLFDASYKFYGVLIQVRSDIKV